MTETLKYPLTLLIGRGSEMHPDPGLKPEPIEPLYDFFIKNEFYIEKGLAELIEKIIKIGKRKAILLRGPAGVGKTQLTYLIARYVNSEYVFFQCAMGTSEDDLLYKYIPSESTRSGIKVTYGPIPRALLASRSKKVVLVIDEFDKTRPSADALLLDVLQNFRISLYLNDDEAVVQGNPENLVIFLTSNDMREFSEPLLRRLISITLKPLPAEKIYQLLSRRFSKEISMLLTQIYSDTINAGLRKPATIQELTQLGEMLEAGVAMSLEELLKMFVVKYDDDWKKFESYVATRKPYDFSSHDASVETSVEVAGLDRYYEPEKQEIMFGGKSKTEQKKKDAASLLEKLRKIVVRAEVLEAKPEQVRQEEQVLVTLKIVDNDFEAYTEVIKTLQPQPTEDPARFGKFEYVEDEAAAVISREPLTIDEAVKLESSNANMIEGYYEGVVFVNNVDVFIANATKVKYYTKDKVFLEYTSKSKDVEEKLVLERIDDVSYRVKGYFKRTSRKAETALLPIVENYSKVSRLADLLVKPRNNMASLADIDVKELFRHVDSVDEAITFIENLKKSPAAGRMKLVIPIPDNRSLCNMLVQDGKLILGYRLAEKVAEELNVTEISVSLADSIVDRIITIMKDLRRRGEL